MTTKATVTAETDIPLLRPHMAELDVVRGIAIVLVLFYHGVAPPLNARLSPVAAMLFEICQRGWVGVNLFFVLSGFLITGILIDSRKKTDYFRRFYIRRALRILPALYVTLLILLLLGRISWTFLALSAAFLANYASFFGIPLQYPPLWSLAVEEHFYLLWPGLIRRLSFRPLAILLAVICAVTPALRAIGFAVAGYRPDFVPFYTWFNLDGLALGALLAIWLRQVSFRRVHLRRVALPSFLLGAGLFVWMLGHRAIEVAFSATACNLASAGLLSSMLLLGTSRFSRAVDRPVLRSLGYVSYGLYLIHVLAFRAAELVLSHTGWISSDRPILSMALRLLAGSGFAIGLAYLSRRSLEERFLRIGYSSESPGVPVGRA